MPGPRSAKTDTEGCRVAPAVVWPVLAFKPGRRHPLRQALLRASRDRHRSEPRPSRSAHDHPGKPSGRRLKLQYLHDSPQQSTKGASTLQDCPPITIVVARNRTVSSTEGSTPRSCGEATPDAGLAGSRGTEQAPWRIWAPVRQPLASPFLPLLFFGRETAAYFWAKRRFS
jgi:hypothetical protein